MPARDFSGGFSVFMKSPNHSAHPSTGLLTFSIVAGSSILFCSKGVFAKLAFAEGTDALTVLALRMAFSLPFFGAMIFFASRNAPRLKFSEWARLAGLGFLGYYLSSLVNFTGLQYVSIGLERIILYTYPSLVLAFSAIVLRKRVRPSIWIACTVAWIGIVAAFAGEMNHPASTGQTLLGGSLIFASALTYAAFIMISGNTIHRTGAMRFTGIAVGFSCLFMLLHYSIAHRLTDLARLSPILYGY